MYKVIFKYEAKWNVVKINRNGKCESVIFPCITFYLSYTANPKFIPQIRNYSALFHCGTWLKLKLFISVVGSDMQAQTCVGKIIGMRITCSLLFDSINYFFLVMDQKNLTQPELQIKRDKITSDKQGKMRDQVTNINSGHIAKWCSMSELRF